MSFKEVINNMYFNVGEPSIEDESLLRDSMFIRKLVDSIPDAMMIINDKREAIFSNNKLLLFVGLAGPESVTGKRPGAILHCRNALNPDFDGCGKTDACKYCGLFNATAKALDGKEALKECKILTLDNKAMDLKVWATPILFAGHNYTIITLADNSAVKRREILEHVFFHDIMNSAGGINGLARLMHESPELINMQEISEMIFTSSEHLIEEIRSQRQIRNAENGNLEMEVSSVGISELLNDVKDNYSSHSVARGKSIEISPDTENISVQTDAVLVRRVIGNMTKNALEASVKGDTVTLSGKRYGRGAILTVHNPGFMPEEVQRQLFARSYSTKGSGRGLGTYSMKLFGEKYLQGKVYFESSELAGTTFLLELPEKIEGAKPAT